MRVVPGRVERVMDREPEVVFIELDERALQLVLEVEAEGEVVGLELVMATEHVHQERQQLGAERRGGEGGCFEMRESVCVRVYIYINIYIYIYIQKMGTLEQKQTRKKKNKGR